MKTGCMVVNKRNCLMYELYIRANKAEKVQNFKYLGRVSIEDATPKT